MEPNAHTLFIDENIFNVVAFLPFDIINKKKVNIVLKSITFKNLQTKNDTETALFFY